MNSDNTSLPRTIDEMVDCIISDGDKILEQLTADQVQKLRLWREAHIIKSMKLATQQEREKTRVWQIITFFFFLMVVILMIAIPTT